MEDFASPFFEGTEKKVEIVIGRSQPSLLDRGDDYWAHVVGRAGAEILSRISNDACTAYVLSESSLFVFEHKMIMLTCGQTTLHDAVLELLQTVPPDEVRMFIYQRKNEAFPHAQPTSFFEDVASFGPSLPGKAFRFGHQDEHHLFLYHLDRPYEGDPGDVTLEILMYGLDESVRCSFTAGRPAGSAPARSSAGLDRIMPGFQVDDHLFLPAGYSLNAIRGAGYYTVHVTPEEVGSYASFETNVVDGDPHELVRRVVDIFRPRSYDLVVFDDGGLCPPDDDRYRTSTHVVQQLGCGYQVRFLSRFGPKPRVGRARELFSPATAPEAFDR